MATRLGPDHEVSWHTRLFVKRGTPNIVPAVCHAVRVDSSVEMDAKRAAASHQRRASSRSVRVSFWQCSWTSVVLISMEYIFYMRVDQTLIIIPPFQNRCPTLY